MNPSERYPKAAVLLAAGRGVRLLPHTVNVPKALLKVNGVPVIDHIFFALEATHIEHVILVTGHLRSVLVKYVGEKFSEKFQISFVNQDRALGTGDALRQSMAALNLEEHQTFLISATDYVFPSSYLTDFIDFHYLESHDISVSLRFVHGAKRSESSLAILGDHNSILKIVEKPVAAESQRTLAATLLYIIPTNISRYLQALKPSLRGEFELADAINLMIADGWSVRGLLQQDLLDWERQYKVI